MEPQQVMGPGAQAMGILSKRSEYQKWADTLKQLLLASGIDFINLIVNRQACPQRPADAAAWQRNNAAINFRIIYSISTELYEKIKGFETAADKWYEIQRIMTTFSNADRVDILTQLFSLASFDWGSDSEAKFIEKFQGIHREMLEANIHIEDGIQAGVFLALLPQKYRTFRTVQAGRDNLSTTDIISAFKAEFKSDQAPMSAAARAARRFRQQPRRPATVPGNRRRPCPNHGDAAVSHTLEECCLKDLICDKCKKKGHKERNCPRQHTSQKSRPDSRQQQHHHRAAVAICEDDHQSAINQAAVIYAESANVVSTNDPESENMESEQQQD